MMNNKQPFASHVQPPLLVPIMEKTEGCSFTILARKFLIYNYYKKITFIILTLRSTDDNILNVLENKYQAD
ncbi:hypothetical protein HNR77_002373 [Paenibacillus sp. JGP012]|nr:hypothetical protein [Paenibacillus sp. JGP012]